MADVRLAGGAVVEIGARLSPDDDTPAIEAAGGALLPGLHDHHIHLLSLAAALEAIPCGPPAAADGEQLAQRLRERAAQPENADGDWIRGVGYHESVAGDIDRHWLDRIVPDRPVRIQHRSGRLWILNSRALARLGATDTRDPGPLEIIDGRPSGRIHDGDTWLRARLESRLPSLRAVGSLLASFGVTGVTDATPRNGPSECRHFAAEHALGHLPQSLLAMGDASLDRVEAGVPVGPTKFHLRESALPAFDEMVERLRASHAAGRPASIHCVTVTELVFAASALAQAGKRPGDRIEHASVAPPEVLALLAGLTVVTQPHFIRERGDAYLADVARDDQPWLYRCRGLMDAGVTLAAGTDAPFGDPDPWLAMQAAVDRRTQAGQVIGAAEALTPEQALRLFGESPMSPGSGDGRVRVGSPADLCILDRPWSQARERLCAVRVVHTFCSGRLVWSRQ